MSQYKIIIYNGFWSIDDVRKMNDYLFIYGDNDIKKGKLGQAIIRDEPNTIGIPTKKLPSNNKNAFYYDDEYDTNIKKIDVAIENIIIKLNNNKNYKGIVLPEKGLGIGLAKLNIYAPLTLKYLCLKIEELKKRLN
jgi:hypothetical protein